MKKYALLLLIAPLGLAPSSASSQTYPIKPITLVVPFAPGGVTDIMARVAAQHIGAQSGQSVVVENRPGASGNLGTRSVARASPDGYTLGLVTSNLIISNPSFFPDRGFDPLKDLVPVGSIGEFPQLLVTNSQVPAKTLQGFIALATAMDLDHMDAAGIELAVGSISIPGVWVGDVGLLFSGALSICPDIRFIFAHGGGAIPYLAGRVAALSDSLSELRPDEIYQQLKQLYFDTALVKSAMAALTTFTPQSRILLGTDAPFLPAEAEIDEWQKLGLDSQVRGRIERDNAAAILRRFT